MYTYWFPLGKWLLFSGKVEFVFWFFPVCIIAYSSSCFTFRFAMELNNSVFTRHYQEAESMCEESGRRRASVERRSLEMRFFPVLSGIFCWMTCGPDPETERKKSSVEQKPLSKDSALARSLMRRFKWVLRNLWLENIIKEWVFCE